MGYPNRFANTNGYTCAEQYYNADRHSDRNTHSKRGAEQDTLPDRYALANPDAESYSHPHLYSDCYKGFDGYVDNDPFADIHLAAYKDAVPNGYSLADPCSKRELDCNSYRYPVS